MVVCDIAGALTGSADPRILSSPPPNKSKPKPACEVGAGVATLGPPFNKLILIFHKTDTSKTFFLFSSKIQILSRFYIS